MTQPFQAGITMLVLLTGCGGEGFALPEGDAERGRDTFVRLGCPACHTVGDADVTDVNGASRVRVKLGGEVSRVRGYEDLVTAIINPSHRLSADAPAAELTDDQGRSRMPSYNEIMTVQELVDLVTYLQPQYRLRVPRRDYPHYYQP